MGYLDILKRDLSQNYKSPKSKKWISVKDMYQPGSTVTEVGRDGYEYERYRVDDNPRSYENWYNKYRDQMTYDSYLAWLESSR